MKKTRLITVLMLALTVVFLLSTVCFAANLKNGSKGNDVKQLQMNLNGLGFDCGKADGAFGKNTEKAVKAFQKAEGLAVDGIAGDKTQSALKKIAKGVQNDLKALGYDPGTVDGIIGSKTVAALKKFQKDHGDSQTGVATDDVRDDLKDALKEMKSNAADKKAEEEAKKKAEAEKKAAEEAKKQAEAEKKAKEEAKKQAEAEKKAAEEAKKQAEAEKKAKEEAKKQAEAEKKAKAEAKKQETKKSSDLDTFKKTESKVNSWFIVDEESTAQGTPLRSAPASGDNIVGYVRKQQAVYVVSKGKNNEGNVWYKLEGDKFIYSSRVHEGKLFTVTYVAADAKNVPAEGKLPESVAAAITKQEPTKKGYKFLGWTTDSNAKTVKYKAGDKVTAYSNMRLYAVWEKLPDATNLETFNNTKSTVGKWYIVTEESTAQGTPLRNAPESAEATKTGKFVKKNESVYVTAKGQNNAGNIWYQLKDGQFIYSERVREAKSFTITFNANGGSGAPGSQPVTEGVKVKLKTSENLERKEYAFVGWSENSTATTATYANGAEITPTKDLKLFAVWVEFPMEELLAAEMGIPQAKNSSDTGICTSAATGTLIRRRQIVDGKEPSFTMSDIRMSLTNPKDPIEKRREKATPTGTSGKNHIYPNISFKVNGYDDNGFSNCYSGDGKQVYKIASVKVATIGSNVTLRKQYVIDLLKSHPEGIYIYAKYNSAKDYNHAVVITSYDEKTKTFYAIDPVDVRDGLKQIEALQDTWLSSVCGGVDNIFKKLTATGIRYIK